MGSQRKKRLSFVKNRKQAVLNSAIKLSLLSGSVISSWKVFASNSHEKVEKEVRILSGL